MIPEFDDPAALRRWRAYFAEVARILTRAGPDASGLLSELEAHAAEGVAASAALGELARLDDALSRLGRPGEYLRPLLADALIERGTRTYSPLTIGRGLFHLLLAGSRRTAIGIAFGLGYLLLAIFTVMAVLKPLWADHVGLFRLPDGTISAGIVAAPPGTQELLGWWSIPIALALAALLYVALTRGLRALRR